MADVSPHIGPSAADSAIDTLRRLNATAPGTLSTRARQARLVGERKPVTAVFADIVGSTSIAETIDPEDWTLIINAAFDEMSRSVFDFEGTIAQLQGDAIISFFGAPVAHEDDPERAVRAALSMIAAMETYGDEVRRSHGIDFRIRVGISTGLVLVGNVGSDLRYDYTAIGDTMNLASRLESAAAPGQILISERTQRFVGPLFVLEDVGPLDLKGKADAVRAFRVLGERATPEPTRGVRGLESPMVGRDAELEVLLGLGAAVRAGRGRTAVIVAEPGLGKSRLVSELKAALAERESSATVADARATAWVMGHASSFGQRMPFHLITSLLLDVLGVRPTSSPEEVDSALQLLLAQVAPDDDEARLYLAPLLGIPISPDEAGEAALVGGDLLAERISGAALRLLKRVAERGPLVVLIEDLHWADAASADFVTAILTLADEAAVLIICTTREEPTSAGWDTVTSARQQMGHALTEIHLEPLDRDGSRDLVANLLEIESLPESTRDLILDKAEGNPFFVEETIRMLLEHGAIERRGDRWVATGTVSSVEIPDTVHGLILARVDRLPDEPRRVLRLASCIDRQFAVPLLEEVARAGGDESPIGGALGRLEAANLITLAGTDPELEYRFSHALIQDAAYETVLRQERREWHRLIAETLLERYPDREEELAAQLARHFDQAGEASRAIDYLIIGAQGIMSRNAMVDAGSMFARAHELLPSVPDPDSDEAARQKLQIWLGRIATGFSFARGDDMLALIAEAAPLAERLDDGSARADLLFWEVLFRQWRGEQPSSSEELRAAIARVAELGDVTGNEVQRSLVLFQTGLILWWRGDFRSSLAMLEQATPLMERHGDVIGSSMAEGYKAVNYASMGDFDEAERRMTASRALAEEADVLAKLDYHLAEAALAALRGDYSTSVRYAGECFGSANELGALGCATVAGIVLGGSQMAIGRPGQAQESLERSLELAAQGYLVPQRMRANVFLASVHGMSGELERAEKGFHIALEDLTSMDNPYGQAEAQLFRGLVTANHPQGDAARALLDLDAARSAYDSLGARPALARTMRALGLAQARLGHPTADASLGQAARMAEEMGLLDGPWPDSTAELAALRSAAAEPPLQAVD